jgi:hypothetical protein
MLVGDDLQTPDCGPSSDERQPLLSSSKAVAKVSSRSDAANLRIILPAVMMCAFLAAFDVTVVAAVYSVMYIQPQAPVD